MYELVTRRAVFCVAGADSDYYPMTKCPDDIKRDVTLASHNIASSASFPNLNNRHLPPDKFDGKSIQGSIWLPYYGKVQQELAEGDQIVRCISNDVSMDVDLKGNILLQVFKESLVGGYLTDAQQ